MRRAASDLTEPDNARLYQMTPALSPISYIDLGMQGRILVFLVKDFKLQLLSEREVKGAVYNVNSFQVTIAFRFSLQLLKAVCSPNNQLIDIGRRTAVTPCEVINVAYCHAGEAHSRRQQQGAAVQVAPNGRWLPRAAARVQPYRTCPGALHRHPRRLCHRRWVASVSCLSVYGYVQELCSLSFTVPSSLQQAPTKACHFAS